MCPLISARPFANHALAARSGGGDRARLQPLRCRGSLDTLYKGFGGIVRSLNLVCVVPCCACCHLPSSSGFDRIAVPALITLLPGICTECGVCDDEEDGTTAASEEGSSRGFGRNVVYEPPPIPEFEGHYRPNSTRAQRLRFRWVLRSFNWFLSALQGSTALPVRRADPAVCHLAMPSYCFQAGLDASGVAAAALCLQVQQDGRHGVRGAAELMQLAQCNFTFCPKHRFSKRGDMVFVGHPRPDEDV